MIKFGITGNIACGKSVFHKIIKENGLTVVDCDDIVKELYSDKLFIENLKSVFPELFSDGNLNLDLLKDFLFNNSHFKAKYENFIFPLVKDKITEFFSEKQTEKIVFVIAPLLFEAGFENMFDKIIFIQADEDIRKQRLIERKSMLSDIADKVINSQIKENEKISRCDYVVNNNGTLEEFKCAVRNLLKSI